MLYSGLIPIGADVPKLVTAAQLAEWLGCSPRTVMNWCKQGILPLPVKLSPRKTLFRTESVRRAIQKLEDEKWSTVEETSNGETR